MLWNWRTTTPEFGFGQKKAHLRTACPKRRTSLRVCFDDFPLRHTCTKSWTLFFWEMNKRLMALNILIFIGIFFILAAIGALIAALVVNANKHNIKVGEVVRTTFTGNPTLLTTALWGPNGEYWNSVTVDELGQTVTTYGLASVWEQDAVNSLHCDMPGAYGTYSTWLGNGGQVPVGTGPQFGSNTTVFFTDQICENATDCYGTGASSSIPCGPGYSAGGGQRQWSFNERDNPYANQCPGGNRNNNTGKPISGSWCSVCASDPNWNKAAIPTDPQTIQSQCKNINSTAVGKCMGVSGTIPYYCAFKNPQFLGGGTNTYKQCAAFTDQDSNGAPIYGQLTSCSVNNNISLTNNPDLVCGKTYDPPSSKPWWLCSSSGNWDCELGQQCVPNWGSTYTGWCATGESPCPLTNKTVATSICSGSVYPNVVMQTTWIAEGQVISRRADLTDTFNVLWDRVQNTYPGIGPSLGFVLPGPYTDGEGYQNKWSEQTALDRNWKYSDCRFFRYTGPSLTRNFSVSQAILGGFYCSYTAENPTKCISISVNPLGLSMFANDYFNGTQTYNSEVQALLTASVLNYCPLEYAADYPANSANTNNSTYTQTRSPNAGWYRTAYQGLSLSGPSGGPPVPAYNGFPCNPLYKSSVIGAAEKSPPERAINSAWNLQSLDINNQQVIRSYFHVIFPFTVTNQALIQHSQSRFLRKANSSSFGFEYEE